MIQVVYSTQHWIVPHIVMGILVVLLAAIILTEGMARKTVRYPGVIHCIYCMSECDWFYRIQYYLRVPV